MMANVFLATLLFILSVTMFSFSSSYGALDRTFECFDETFAAQCINAIDASQPFFDKDVLNQNTYAFFKNNLDQYKPMIKYTWDIEYLNGFYEDDVYHLTAFDVSLDGSFLSSYHYRNVSSFYIKEGEAIYG